MATQKEPDYFECQMVMIAYRKTLKQLIADYAPTGVEEPPSDRFFAAVKSYRKSGEVLDELLSPNFDERREAVASLCEGGKLLRIKQFIIDKGGPLMWEMK